MNLRTEPAPYRSPSARWRAVRSKDRAASGQFVFAVTTTGVFCRPGCAARTPKREHVTFFDDAPTAAAHGFRACLRCRPTEAVDAAPRWVSQVVELLEAEDVQSLSQVAEVVGLSRAHLSRAFTQHVGVTMQAYRRRVLAERAKAGLPSHRTVVAAALAAGVGSVARYYAGPAKELGMSARARRESGAGVQLFFTTALTALGAVLVGWTSRGICDVRLGDSASSLERAFRERFARATSVERGHHPPPWVRQAIAEAERPTDAQLPLDVHGTVFQERVWQALRRLRAGQTLSYAELAMRIGRPTAARAVARAVATNSVAVLIPCHRIVRTDGSLGGYRWGEARKKALLAAEAKVSAPHLAR